MQSLSKQPSLRDKYSDLVVAIPLFNPTKEDIDYWSHASKMHASVLFILVHDNQSHPVIPLVNWEGRCEYGVLHNSNNLHILQKESSRGILSSIWVAADFAFGLSASSVRSRIIVFDQDTRWTGKLPTAYLSSLPEDTIGYPQVDLQHNLRWTPTFRIANQLFSLPWPQWSGLSFSSRYIFAVSRGSTPCVYHSDLFFILTCLPRFVHYTEYKLHQFDHVPSHEKKRYRVIPLKNHRSILHSSSTAYALLRASLQIFCCCRLRFKCFALIVVAIDSARLLISWVLRG